MDHKERQTLVAAWIEHHKIGRQTGESPEATFWAWEKIDELVSNDPDQAWELILQILAADQTDVTYENLAAGPLDGGVDNLGHGHAQQFAEFGLMEGGDVDRFHRCVLPTL